MTSLAEQAVFAFLRMHDKIYQATNGRIGHRMPGMPPSLLLHTVGAKTGQQRVTTLSYARDGDDYLVVASKGGDPRAPGWYHNLKTNPNIEISVGSKRFTVTAHPVLPDNPDYARLATRQTRTTPTATSSTRRRPRGRFQ
jgi:deazaflavin-dependent oxidoreductase (nitroreductase family)